MKKTNKKNSLTFTELKRLVNESADDPFKGLEEKEFKDVERGDIAMRYDVPFVVLGKGIAGEIEDPDGSIQDGIENDWIDEYDPCVLVQSFYDGTKTAFVYGDAGVIVKDSFGNIKSIDRI